MADSFCLKIQIMPDGSRLRYEQSFSGSTMDMVSLPVSRALQAVLITMERQPGDKRIDITRSKLAQIIREWRQQAIDVLLVDHRKATQEVTLPSGIVLNRSSHLLLLVKAFQQWKKGEMVLAEDDAQALKVWIGDRVPFGMDAVEAIKDMEAVNKLENI